MLKPCVLCGKQPEARWETEQISQGLGIDVYVIKCCEVRVRRDTYDYGKRKAKTEAIDTWNKLEEIRKTI